MVETAKEIEEAIARLPRKDFWQLTDRLLERREARWDERIAEDARSGRLDALWAKAEKEIDAGATMPLDPFLDNKDFPASSRTTRLRVGLASSENR